MKALLFGIALAAMLATPARARDLAQYDPGADRSFWSDRAVQSCCGEGDAYWADYWEAQADGSWNVWVTDDREVVGRANDRDGRKYNIPADKIRFSPPNTTGHGILFLSQPNPDYVYCYFPGVGG